MYLYVGLEDHYYMHRINYDLFYLQSVVPLYIDMIILMVMVMVMQYTISSELWPVFKSKALRSSTLYNVAALYTRISTFARM